MWVFWWLGCLGLFWFACGMGRGSWAFLGRLVTRKQTIADALRERKAKLESEERDIQRWTQAVADAEAEILQHAALPRKRWPNCTSAKKR
jgi:hypothetical protein